MILQALVSYYETLARQGKIAKPGWCQAKISYALNIDSQGNLKGVIPLLQEEQRGKKTLKVPRLLSMPEGEKRSSDVKAQFLWDNAIYFLGLAKDGKEERGKQCFIAAGEKCQQVLSSVTSKNALALKEFFAKWNPDNILSNTLLQPYLDEFSGAANLTFMVEDEFINNDQDIAEAWDEYYAHDTSENEGVCLVTGKKGPIARLHPKIKGIAGAQSSGAALVAFNAPAYESYGHTQGMNANIGKYAAFAYTTALNYLLTQKEHYQRFSDTTVVFWAESAEECYAEFFDDFFGNNNVIEDKDLKTFFENISKGIPFTIKDNTFSPDTKFYILGISPNASRLSVRFFLANTFGYFVQNIKKFYQEFEIDKPNYDTKEQIPLWQILQETANKNAKDKSATPVLAGSVLRSILSGNNYPEALYQNVILRAKADQDNTDKKIKKINRIKASVIKAYLMRNKKENIMVALDEERNDAGYVLGRMFAVLEHLQETANPGINSTIKNRYFNSACSTPGIIFPLLLKLSNSHLRKISGNKGMAINFERDITALFAKIKEIPKRLDLREQGEFMLGYYHQVQYRYTKKEDK